MFQCIPQLQPPTEAPGIGRFLDRTRSAELWAKWLACLTPFFKESERKEAGCQHRLFFSQVEYCDNLIFHRRAALDQLGQRPLDANRTIGQPKKITTIFGRKVTRHYKGKLHTII